MSRKLVFHLLALLIVLVAVSCAPAATPTVAPTAAPTVAPTLAPTPSPVPPTATPVPPSPTPASLTVTDAAGRLVTLGAVPQRLVSLAPNMTEILFALDLGKQTVGVDAFSDYPAEAKPIAKISGPDGKFNFEQIVASKPDLILAAGGIASPADIKKLEELKLTVIVVGSATTTFDSVINDILLLGGVTGRGEQAKKLTDSMKQKLDSIKVKVAGTTTKPRVYWELDATDATKPYTVGPGNFINDIIALAGGVNVFADAKSPFAQVSVEQIIKANPEVIILSDAAYGVTVDSVVKRAGWSTLSAVKNNQVFPIDDNLVSRPGPRLVEGLEAAARLIHPEAFK